MVTISTIECEHQIIRPPKYVLEVVFRFSNTYTSKEFVILFKFKQCETYYAIHFTDPNCSCFKHPLIIIFWKISQIRNLKGMIILIFIVFREIIEQDILILSYHADPVLYLTILYKWASTKLQRQIQQHFMHVSRTWMFHTLKENYKHKLQEWSYHHVCLPNNDSLI